MDTDKNWHLKKELNIGHILTTLMLAIGIIAWGNSLSERVAILEAQSAHYAVGILQTKEDCNLLRTEIIGELRLLRSDINILYRAQQAQIREINGGSRQ